MFFFLLHVTKANQNNTKKQIEERKNEIQFKINRFLSFLILKSLSLSLSLLSSYEAKQLGLYNTEKDECTKRERQWHIKAIHKNRSYTLQVLL